MSKVSNIIDEISEIELISSMGSDLSTVNAARQSYQRASQELNEKDFKLISYLGKHQHHAPFRHTVFTLRVKAPEFVARQWYKHVVGSTYNFNDSPWSEASQRYSTVEPEYYVPSHVRSQDSANKQSSIPTTFNRNTAWLIKEALKTSISSYQRLIALGVAREMARIVLPLSIYTEFVWTASLQTIAHFCALRAEIGAQWEIRMYAEALASLCKPVAPYSWEALITNHPILKNT